MRYRVLLFVGVLLGITTLATPVFAQVYQSTAQKQTAVGNATLPNSGAGLADLAETVVNNLKSGSRGNCHNYSNGFAHVYYGDVVNGNCNDSQDLNSAWADEIVYSVKTFTDLQCVNFVKAVAEAAGHKFNTAGNAIDYATRVPSGYKWIPVGSGNPQRGDIAIWASANGCRVGNGENGHIAIVTGFSGGDISVAEANWGSAPGIVAFDTYRNGTGCILDGALVYAGVLRLQQ